jgi:hypothetical protein
VLPLALVVVSGDAYKWQRIVKICQWQRLGCYGTWLKGRPLKRMLRIVGILSFGCVVHGDANNRSADIGLRKKKIFDGKIEVYFLTLRECMHA